MKLNNILFVIGLFLGIYSHACIAAEYVVAVRAKNGIEDAIQQWQPTVDYLSGRTPIHSFTLKPIVSLEEIRHSAAMGRFDFLITNPASYVELKLLYGAEAMATLNNRRANTAQNRFGSVIFTHAKNDDIVRISDLMGKRVMGVSELAFGGWRVAWAEMLENGVDPQRDFSELLFADGLQEDVVYAVRDGVADVGIVRTDQLERMEAAGKIDLRYFRILNNKDIKSFPFFLSTPLYPEWSFVSLKQAAPKSLTEGIKQVLLDLPGDSAAAHAGKYIGWIEPLDHSSVENLLRKLKAEAFDN